MSDHETQAPRAVSICLPDEVKEALAAAVGITSFKYLRALSIDLHVMEAGRFPEVTAVFTISDGHKGITDVIHRLKLLPFVMTAPDNIPR